MKIFGRNLFAPAQKASAAASVMVQYIVGRPQHQRRNYEKASREAYIQNSIVYNCINAIARPAAGADLDLFRGMGENKIEVEESEVLDLLYRPNPRMGDDAFFFSLYSTFLIGGEVFVERVLDSKGAVIELWLHRPDRMTVTPGPTGLPERYTYENCGTKKIFECDKITGDSDILHLRNFNPVDDWRGLSALDPASYSIDQHNEASAWNYGLLKNGARPSGALMVKSSDGNRNATLTDSQFLRLKSEINETMSGGANAGKPIILEGDMDWKEFSLNPKDMDYVNSVHESARNIARAFGVPPILLGIPGDSTFNNIREAKLALWEDTIIPMINFVLAEFNHWLLPKFSPDLYLELCKENISALSLRRDERRKSLQIADYLTLNEKRDEDGKQPIDGGDEVLVESTKVPIEMAGEAQRNAVNAMANVDSNGGGDSTPSADMSKEAYIDFLISKQGFPAAQAKRIAEIVYGV